GAAIAALLAIVAVTVAWWALALWPADAGAIEWLERTRAACFGSPPGGLPDTRGWLLLIGEPLGMVALLLVVWPGAVMRDIRRWRSSLAGRAALYVLPVLVVGLLAIAVRQVAAVQRAGAPPTVEPAGIRRDFSADLQGLVLVDQQGVRRSLVDLAERPALLTAAFGHCETVCPTMVHDLIRMRDQSGRGDLPVIVITVDPWRDTPNRLAGIAALWQLGEQDLLLSGTVDEVELALDRLKIARSRDLRTGDVAHVPVVFRLDAGRVTTRFDGGWGAVLEGET
ncbi:MAG TPA: SCO family protein, partial [Gemmatimonadales bacterium]|nr:SCO family protein [Gemmatimonadales bacterium]